MTARSSSGCVQPGENSASFGEALRQLASQSTYLYVDQGRYWYSTQPSVAQLARERADRYEPEIIFDLIHKRIQQAVRNDRGFARIRSCPPDNGQVLTRWRRVSSSSDRHFPSRQGCGLARTAPDEAHLSGLAAAVREYKAWESIFDEKETLNLNESQRKQAKNQARRSKRRYRVAPPGDIYLAIGSGSAES